MSSNELSFKKIKVNDIIPEFTTTSHRLLCKTDNPIFLEINSESPLQIKTQRLDDHLFMTLLYKDKLIGSMGIIGKYEISIGLIKSFEELVKCPGINVLINNALGKDETEVTMYIKFTDENYEDIKDFISLLIKNYNKQPNCSYVNDNNSKGITNIKRIFNEYFDDYHKNWIDTPDPGLDGMTPRNASKTEKGRKKLELIFLQKGEMEFMNEINGIPPFPLEKIKKELGM